MNRMKNFNEWLEYYRNDFVDISEIEHLQKKISVLTKEINRKAKTCEIATDLAFLDGSILILNWIEDELSQMKGESKNEPRM